MESEILKTIVDLINTSEKHKAWLDEHPQTGFGDGQQRLHISGLSPDAEISIVGPILTIEQHKFDLNDPTSINKIEALFDCSTDKKPIFDPIQAIALMTK